MGFFEQVNTILAHMVLMAVLLAPFAGILLILGAGSIQADAEARRMGER